MLIIIFLSLQSYNSPSKTDNLQKEKQETPKPEESNQQTSNKKTENKTEITEQTEPKTNEPPTTNSSIPSKEQMINFFIELATMNHEKTAHWGVGRWQGTVRIGFVEGAPTQGHNSGLTDLINNFNSISKTTNLLRDDRSADIKIYVLTSDEIYRRSDGRESHSHAFYNADDNCYIRSGTVYLEANSDFSDYLEYITIRHEVTHALGFLGHSDIFPNSIMAIFHANYSYPYEDRKLFDMMYNSGIPVCTREAAIRNFFNSNYQP